MPIYIKQLYVFFRMHCIERTHDLEVKSLVRFISETIGRILLKFGIFVSTVRVSGKFDFDSYRSI